ncbi:MAG TPA: cytochrome b N-terminal domain-containing protein [Gemmatimonadales bacterium]
MPRISDALQRCSRRVLAPLDAACNRLYGWRHNPLYQSGTIAVALLGVVLITGVYLLFFYRIGEPYGSVARLADQRWLGGWIRSFHRYASDAAVVAVAVHAFRMFAQDRSWGPRALAWVSGLVLLFVVLVCGWTGYVMVWDAQGLTLAREGARFLDVLPLFSEPIGRSFVGDLEIPSAFFFLNLFLHVALPVAVGLILWVHVARIARPLLLPPRPLTWGVVLLLLALSVFVPASIGPEADLFRVAERAPFDWFFNFWLPFTRPLPAWLAWIGTIVVSTALLAIPWIVKPRGVRRAPSVVDERLCTGCRTCYLDCPYEAISMVPRDDGRAEFVARVDPALCVSCGICSGSCAPMGVGPRGRTGRDQLAGVKAFVAALPADHRAAVVIACTHGAGRVSTEVAVAGVRVHDVDCLGNLHSSVIEYLLRSGVGGVLIASCPPRDCRNREGPKWLEQRMYFGREAELKQRVDRRRILVVYAGEGERGRVLDGVNVLHARVAALDQPGVETDIEIDLECEPVPEEVTP